MYNLLVSAVDGFWEGSPVRFTRSRIFEYTSSFLRKRFLELEKPTLDELIGLPCLFAYEEGVNNAARVGRITNFRKRETDVRIEFQLDGALPPIPTDSLRKLAWELDIEEWELNRTHWAVKDVDLIQELIKSGNFNEMQVSSSYFSFSHAKNTTSLEITPTVFRIPAGGIEHDLVAVMRPFNSAFRGVYIVLKDAGDELGLKCMDVNEVWEENEIIQDVFSLIYRARAVICDFSDRNPNVFYEAGIAHTLGRHVIPIVQNAEHIPFDLKHHRYIQYINNGEGLAELKKSVVGRLKTLFGKPSLMA